MKRKFEYSRGQVILIILLVTVVGLTIGLSLVSRTIQDVRLSSQIAESQKAFSAAESGIEAALKGAAIDSVDTLTLSGGSRANYNVSEWGGSSAPFAIPDIADGESVTVWLVDHNDDGSVPLSPPPTSSFVYTDSVDVCWGPKGSDSDPNPKPSLEFTLLFRDGSTYKIGKTAYNPDTSSSDNFEDAQTTGGNTYCSNSDKKYRAQLKFNDNFGIDREEVPIALRVKPVYNSTDIVVDSGSKNLPPQGKQISSTGTTDTGVARKINVLQGYNSLPPIFDYTLFVNQEFF